MEHINTWAIVSTGSVKYIGEIEEYHKDGFFDGWVVMNPCYEYVSQPQLQQMGQSGVAYRGRIKCILPHEHLMNPVKVHLKPTEITFLDDMTAKERQEYRDMIDQIAEHIKLSRIQKETGLVTASAIPNS